MIPWSKPCKDRAFELFKQDITPRECAEIINREFGTAFNVHAIKAMRRRMGISRARPGFEWTQDRLALLHKAAEDKIGPVAAARLIGVSKDVISRQCRKLGLELSEDKNLGPRWTDERDAELRRLRTVEGMTTVEIAEAMGKRRGAIIARLGRLGIKAADATVKKPKVRPKKPKTPCPAKPNMLGKAHGFFSLGALPTEVCLALVDKDMALPESRRISIDSLRNATCRWPLGHPRDDGFSYCGAHGADYAAGKPYCAGHMQIGYRPSQERKRELGHILRVTQGVAA